MIKIPEKCLKALDHLFIFMPAMFFIVWIIFLAGYSSFFFFNGQQDRVWWSFEISLLGVINFVLITLAMGATFIFGQLREVSISRQTLAGEDDNEKLSPIIEKYVSPEKAKKIAFVSIGITLIFFLIQGVLMPVKLPAFILLSILIILRGYVLNSTFTKGKNSCFIEVTIAITTIFLLFLIGFIIAGCWQTKAMIYSIPYIFVFGSVFLLTTIPGSTESNFHREKAFGVRFGIKPTIWIATILIFLGFGVGMLNYDPLITTPTLLSLPLFIIMLFRPNVHWAIRCIRYSVLFIALTLSVEFPLFFILLLINYYLSRIYNYNRFNLDYPTFSIEKEKVK